MVLINRKVKINSCSISQFLFNFSPLFMKIYKHIRCMYGNLNRLQVDLVNLVKENTALSESFANNLKL